jgi:hypothetical protein
MRDIFLTSVNFLSFNVEKQEVLKYNPALIARFVQSGRVSPLRGTKAPEHDIQSTQSNNNIYIYISI